MGLADLAAKTETGTALRTLVDVAYELIESKQIKENYYCPLADYLSDIKIKLGIEPVRIVGNLAYYSESDIARIVEHLKKKGYKPQRVSRQKKRLELNKK